MAQKKMKMKCSGKTGDPEKYFANSFCHKFGQGARFKNSSLFINSGKENNTPNNLAIDSPFNLYKLPFDNAR